MYLLKILLYLPTKILLYSPKTLTTSRDKKNNQTSRDTKKSPNPLGQKKIPNLSGSKKSPNLSGHFSFGDILVLIRTLLFGPVYLDLYV